MMVICLLELPEPGRRKVVPRNWLKALRGLGFWEPKPLFGDRFRSERERLGIARDLLAARQQGLARGACRDRQASGSGRVNRDAATWAEPVLRDGNDDDDRFRVVASSSHWTSNSPGTEPNRSCCSSHPWIQPRSSVSDEEARIDGRKESSTERKGRYGDWFSSTLTLPLLPFATARSGFRSPLKSPTATEKGDVPTGK